MKTKNSYLIVFLVGFILTQCTPKKTDQGCSLDFFEKVAKQDSAELKIIFKLDSATLVNNKCSYKHELLFWQGNVVENKPEPYLKWNGRIFNTNGTIYFELDSGNTIKYLDFRMPVGQPEPIQVSQSVSRFGKEYNIQRNYELILEEKFYDETNQDTICKFRFSKLNITTSDDDLVLFVGFHCGLKGAYNSSVNDQDNIEEVLSKKGMIYPSRSKYKQVFIKGHLL